MRSRIIKPGFFENEKLSNLPHVSRLLFIGLWMIADREGRFKWRPKLLWAQIFPYQTEKVATLESHLMTLVTNGFINRYSVEGELYGEVANFKSHQKIHPNEAKSILPSSDIGTPCNDIGKQCNPEIPLPLPLPQKRNTSEISSGSASEKSDLESKSLALKWRDMARSKNNGWPKDKEWPKLERSWSESIRLLLSSDKFTREEFLSVITAFESGALDSETFVWARDAVKSPAKLRRTDKDGMKYMQVVLSRLTASKIIANNSTLPSFEKKYATDIYSLGANRKGGVISETEYVQSICKLRERYNNWRNTEAKGRLI